ncbi:glycosyltransferase family 4 protein [Rubrolithibacter danxiaensis]|uniref:glycosyltransferase family 4 protein n=1 Tax=Rubrolithibacter danxiaensis TaxID=3390805 RepID=UPI003BF7F153
MNRKKILVFSDCYIYGGSERLISFLIKNEIIKAHFEVYFSYRAHSSYNIGMKDDYRNVSKQLIFPLMLLSNETLFFKINCLQLPFLVKAVMKLPFYILQKFQIYTLWNAVILFLLLKKVKPDIVHVNNGGYPAAKNCNLLVWINKIFHEATVIYQVNNQAQKRKAVWDVFFDRKIVSYVDKFITASFLAKNSLITNRKFDSEKIVVFNNCVEPSTVKRSRAEVLKDLQLSKSKFLIVQVAFLTKRKGQAYLIEAIDQLVKERKDIEDTIQVLLIGDGEDEKKLKDIVTTKGLEKIFSFLGYRTDSPDYISACNIFVLPSISHEDMPLVILTALQLGKPIIASDFAGIAQAIQSGENGILVNCETKNLSRNLAESIKRLYDDPDFCTKLSNAAKDSFQNYTPEKYGRSLVKLYQEVEND